MKHIIKDKKHLPEAARMFLRHFGEKRIFAFYGSMGAGKTTIIKAICKALGAIDLVRRPALASRTVVEHPEAVVR